MTDTIDTADLVAELERAPGWPTLAQRVAVALRAQNAEIARLTGSLAAEKAYGEHHIALNVRLHQEALAERDTARAETAMAFEVAANANLERTGREWVKDSLWANMAEQFAKNVRAIAPADATAALTAAQERIEALEEVRLAIDAGWTVHEGDLMCYETDFILHQLNRIDAALAKIREVLK